MPGKISSLFSFPNPVNEVSARVVAGGVVLMSAAFVVTQNGWILLPLSYGFIARVLAGPRLSPLGRLATHFITPRLGLPQRLVPGPPKRFAQTIGMLFSLTASVLWLFDLHFAATVTIGLLALAASLESFVGVCLGCLIFSQLMLWKIIPASICAECNDITLRAATARQ